MQCVFGIGGLQKTHSSKRQKMADIKQKQTLPEVSGVGLTKKQIAFSKSFVDNGEDEILAYENSFSCKGLNYHDKKHRAKKLLERANVQSLIWDLRRAKGAGYAVEREGLTEALIWAINRARQNGDVKEVRGAVMDLAKLHGLVVDKADITNSHNFQVMDQVTIDGSKLIFDIGSPVEDVERIRQGAQPRITDASFTEVVEGEELL